jgi:hypothetical protein
MIRARQRRADGRLGGVSVAGGGSSCNFIRQALSSNQLVVAQAVVPVPDSATACEAVVDSAGLAMWQSNQKLLAC